MNPRGLIDAHTHAFPNEIVHGREDYCARDTWFDHLYRPSSVKLTTEVELLESMEASGVSFSVIAGFPWGDEGICREHNAWMAEVCARYPDRLGFLAIVVPDDREAAVDAEAAFASGALGIGELNADAQGFDLTAPETASELMEVAAEHARPVMLHASEPLGHDYPGKGTATPDKLVRFLSVFHNQPVILAHWGGGLPFYELMPEIHQVTRHVVYDCAASTYLYDFRVFPTVISLAGADRVVFGSDFPVLGQRRLIKRVAEVIDDEDALQAVMMGNAARIFGLAG